MAEEEKQRKTRALYWLMPGAERVPFDEEGLEMWGEVDFTDHYRFCEMIVDMIAEARDG